MGGTSFVAAAAWVARWTPSGRLAPISRVNPSRLVDVRIDLARVRVNALDVKRSTGMPVIAVVKADAYGHGAAEVVRRIGDVVEAFCVFSLREAVEARIWEQTGKPTLAIGPPMEGGEAEDYLAHNVRPAVSDEAGARRLAGAGPVLCVDTGMQRFACPSERVAEVVRAGAITEAYTHAISVEQAVRFGELTRGLGLRRRHAAGSSLLGEPAARFDAVRPGMALYRGAARVTTRLEEVRESKGAIGYSRWTSETGRHGVVLVGYSNGLRPGPCVVNGVTRRIAEVGMQSSFVEVGSADRAGDEVVLLGEGLAEERVGEAWKMSPHEALVRLCGLGVRNYVG
jgi:alanine racemase